MPSRGRIPPFVAVLVLSFMFVGLVGFQIVKERKIAVDALGAKESELENIETSLKEQLKETRKREEERDYIQIQVTELERVSKSAHEVLRTRDEELENLKREHAETVHELEQLRKVVLQKEGEIVYVRGQLNKYSFEKAKESAEQITNQAVPTVEEREEESKHADEAGLSDRNRIQEEEDRQTETEHASATEQEMFERSLHKGEIGKLGHTGDNEEEEAADDLLKRDTLEDEEAEEQDSADTRDPDEKENDTNLEDELTDEPESGAELRTVEDETKEPDHKIE